jgi:hypothetical protein
MKVESKETSGIGSLGRVKRHKTNKRVFMQNIEIGFRKQPKHTPTLEAHLHGKHPHPKYPTKRKKTMT